MRNLLNNKLLFLIFFSTFLITLFLVNNVNEWGHFYEENLEYYQKKIKLDFLQGVPSDKENLITGIETIASNATIIEFDLPNYNAETGTKVILPQRTLSDPTMAEGKYFDSKDKRATAVIGKDVFETLKPAEKKERRLNALGQSYQVIGILGNSPYNNSVLLNGNYALKQKTIGSLINNFSIHSPTLSQSTFELSALRVFFGYPADDPNNTTFVEQFDAENFYTMSEDFKIFSIELLIVAVVSIAIQYYQKFDYWKKEIGIRKMIGGTTLRIVIHTFSKYFKVLSAAFVLAAGIFLAAIRFLPLETNYGLLTALQSCGDVVGIYLALLVILLLSTIFYVKRLSVISILAGEDE